MLRHVQTRAIILSLHCLPRGSRSQKPNGACTFMLSDVIPRVAELRLPRILD